MAFIFHIVPDNDTYDHLITPNCGCGPAQEVEGELTSFVHNKQAVVSLSAHIIPVDGIAHIVSTSCCCGIQQDSSYPTLWKHSPEQEAYAGVNLSQRSHAFTD